MAALDAAGDSGYRGAVATIVEEHRSANRRYVVELDDGGRVEAVRYRDDSLCVSSQVGCAVGCPFCASGAKGFARNLAPHELVAQVELAEARGEGAIARVTVSGVGEPLHNRAVEDFVTWCRERGTPASFTTSGGPLARLASWLDVDAPHHNGISLSIHAGREATRARTVPRGPALEPLFELLRDRVPRLSGARRRKLALAYLLLADQNDDDAEIDAFLARAAPLGLKIHLYSYNPVPTSAQAPTQEERLQAVYERVQAAGLNVRRSSQARMEENGGCGTLVALRPTSRRGISNTV